MLCVAFLAHYNAISYYNELKDKTIHRYKQAISIGFSTAGAVFITMMIIGYLLFGSTSLPLILNNFHISNDILATCARGAIGSAIIFAYPLMFNGVKTSLMNLLPTSIQNNKMYVTNAITIILSIISIIAIKCSEEDVSVVLGIVGSVLGCSVAFILPAFLRLIWLDKKNITNNNNNLNYKLDILGNKLLFISGMIFAILGVIVTIKSSGSHH